MDGMHQGSITGSTSSLTSPSQLVMGSTLTGFNFLRGDIAEVLIYSSALSDADRTAIENYLNSKYAVVAAPPSAPSGLATVALSSSQVNLTWAANSQNETAFKIERKQFGGSYAEIAQVKTAVTTYVDAAALPGVRIPIALKPRMLLAIQV